VARGNAIELQDFVDLVRDDLPFERPSPVFLNPYGQSVWWSRRRFCNRAYLVTLNRFGGDTVWCPIETAAYDLEWPVGDLATQFFGSDGMSNG